MAQHKKTQTALNLSKGVFYILLLIYGVYVIGTSIKNNYTTNEQIKLLRQEIAVLKDDIDSIKDTIVYYQTDSFKELEARQRLGLKGAGETIIMLPKNNEHNNAVNIQPSPESFNSEEETLSNPEKWYQYIFE